LIAIQDSTFLSEASRPFYAGIQNVMIKAMTPEVSRVRIGLIQMRRHKANNMNTSNGDDTSQK
jgi:hypothetical protein